MGPHPHAHTPSGVSSRGPIRAAVHHGTPPFLGLETLLSGVPISSHNVGKPTAGSSQAPAMDTSTSSQAWEATPQSVLAGTQVEWQTE